MECPIISEESYFDRIYLNDWPLKLLNEWFQRLVDTNGFILPEICQSLVDGYTVDQRISVSNFSEIIFSRTPCGGKICKNECNNKCATAGNIKTMLIRDNLHQYTNFQPIQERIFSHFFFKLNDSISQVHVKYRIGILILYLDIHGESDFIKKERFLIINQLSNQFYITDYLLVDAQKQLFHHIKNYIDVVVIIVDSNYENNKDLDEYYEILKQFKFLKIFLIKTEDLSIMRKANDNQILIHFQKRFPEHDIVIYDWLQNPEGLPKIIRNKLTTLARLQIAICSHFVRKTSTQQIDTN